MYSYVSVGKCHGTLAYHCRKWKEETNYEVDQSSCPVCRDDWKAIFKDCLPIDHKDYKKFSYIKKGKNKEEKVIYWRYGKDIGLFIIGKQKDPLFYFRFAKQSLLHSAHYTRLICPHCSYDLSFITFNKNHVCYKNPSDNSKNALKFNDDLLYYSTKYVVLTLSRISSGVVSTKINLMGEHDKLHRIALNHIIRPYENADENDVVHGQRYHKVGQCGTTLMQSNLTQFGFNSFLHISNNINHNFIEAKAIFLVMNVSSSIGCSPFYISELLSSLNYPLYKITFLLMNFKDSGHLNENEVRISIPASDIQKLCHEDSLYPFHYFGNEIETNVVLNALTCQQTKVSWQFFESLKILQEERKLIANSGRLDPITNVL